MHYNRVYTFYEIKVEELSLELDNLNRRHSEESNQLSREIARQNEELAKKELEMQQLRSDMSSILEKRRKDLEVIRLWQHELAKRDNFIKSLKEKHRSKSITAGNHLQVAPISRQHNAQNLIPDNISIKAEKTEGDSFVAINPECRNHTGDSHKRNPVTLLPSSIKLPVLVPSNVANTHKDGFESNRRSEHISFEIARNTNADSGQSELLANKQQKSHSVLRQATSSKLNVHANSQSMSASITEKPHLYVKKAGLSSEDKDMKHQGIAEVILGSNGLQTFPKLSNMRSTGMNDMNDMNDSNYSPLIKVEISPRSNQTSSHRNEDFPNRISVSEVSEVRQLPRKRTRTHSPSTQRHHDLEMVKRVAPEINSFSAAPSLEISSRQVRFQNRYNRSLEKP